MVLMPATVPSQGGGAALDGVLERVTFANPETGYTIARIASVKGEGEVGGGAELVTAVGPLLGAQVGEFLRLRGRWSSHPKYGRQFEVHSYATVLPATAAGLQRYLGSGLVKGIGPVMAERMVAHFGVDIMHVIDHEPGRLIEVDGLGPKRTAMIAAAWAEQKAIKEVMIFLQGVGVSTSLAVRIYKKYGDASVSVVRSEPYRLAADVWGIGFKTADTIAASVGIPRDSPERIKAGLGYTLSEAADDGHCYLPAPNLIADAAKILEVPAELVGPALDELAAAEGAVREDVPAGAEDAGSLPVVRLTKVFRQAQQSGIVVNAHRINAGQMPVLSGFGDFFWSGCEDTEQTAGLVVDIVAQRIPARFGLDPRRDVQVLCPMHRGPAGAGNLNLLLQDALTPFREGAPERRYGGRVFRVGDKVTQLRNNYDKGAAGVFNGTVGVVTGMSAEDHRLTVLTDEDESVNYGFDELDELAHAYAVTIHRSQGSESPAVVIPLTTGSWMMLQRNLLYTGVTRARRLVVLAGSRRALAAAVRTKGAGRRHTALAHRLQPDPQPLDNRRKLHR
jgi:ATP-dependent exoDNAse (exonuclease V) alpha subunit